METVTLKLPIDVVARLERIAHDEDVSVGQIVRAALERDLHWRGFLISHPQRPAGALAEFRAHAGEAFQMADGWRSLRERLIEAGFTLREAGGGLALHDAITGRFLCRTSEIGFGYPALLRRFGRPFPGHSKTALLERISKVDVVVNH